MFTQRTGTGIFFTGIYQPGDEIRHTVRKGDSVTLKVGNETILVKDIQSADSNHFTGEIYGFEPSMGVEYHSLEVGQMVEFHESEIHGCDCS